MTWNLNRTFGIILADGVVVSGAAVENVGGAVAGDASIKDDGSAGGTGVEKDKRCVEPTIASNLTLYYGMVCTFATLNFQGENLEVVPFMGLVPIDLLL
ncbi:hypothetical protein V6N12_007596 [Hibiscus sabdariffa]|uniref:Uncharacterized protein n=1 Tax=Hibiscus sabdariffa TaxID=183260 RepID=A0ABR2F299_9ROSI